MICSSPLYDSVLVTASRYKAGLSRAADAMAPISEEIIENYHLGWVVVFDHHQGILYSTPGATEIATFFRSAAKPFQTFPLVADGYADALTREELAVACASHTGSHRHLALAGSILKKAGYPADALQCGPHKPTDAAMLSELRQEQRAPEKLHNNCSGKHAGMLLYCRLAALDPTTYLDIEHPLQQRILGILRQWGGVEDIPLAIDGCGAPVFHLPLVTMARLYAYLGSDEAFSAIREAMISYPEVIGGEGLVDTVIMQASKGKLLAKVGADGVLCVSRVGMNQGLALKIADGSAEIRNLALVEILARLGWLEENALQDSRLQPYRDNRRTNTQGKTIGRYQVHMNPETAAATKETPKTQSEIPAESAE
jgi:L-asparaginase II